MHTSLRNKWGANGARVCAGAQGGVNRQVAPVFNMLLATMSKEKKYTSVIVSQEQFVERRGQTKRVHERDGVLRTTPIVQEHNKGKKW